MTLNRIRETRRLRAEPVRTWAAALLILTFVAGCRTYGGYGTEEKTVVTIEQANEQFARTLARAEGDLAALREATATNPRLLPVAREYEHTVVEHAMLLEAHRAAYARLTAGRSGYRASSRLLGSIVTDQHLIANRYRSAVEGAAELAGRPPAPLRSSAQYQQVPPDYMRLENRIAEQNLGDVIRPGA